MRWEFGYCCARLGLSLNCGRSTRVGLRQLVASLVAGILWDQVGHGAVFYYGAVFGLIGLVALVAMIPNARSVTSTQIAAQFANLE